MNGNKNFMVWIGIALAVMTLFQMSQQGLSNSRSEERTYSEVLDLVENNAVSQITIQGNQLQALQSDGTKLTANAPYDPDLIKNLREKNVNISVKPQEEESLLLRILISWFPFILMIGVWIFFMRQMQGGKGGAMSFGKSRAQMLTENQIKVTFDDVAGVEEAKQELQEVVDFLKDPSKFQRLGGKIPKGVLLVGPPGTGKTLLARSVAGEAGVPFFSISGSDFVEMFVGVGASRVRDLFEQGKKNAPCIIFIDEIDAVGRQRGAGIGGGNDEREQTLNQLLVEMDGFESNEGVILIAATNRADVLDKALMRPGRFDRQVVVPLPDIKGREYILKVHMRKVPLSADVDANVIARGTPGFSGAELANLVNEAALMAARSNKRLVDMDDFESAKDKVMMGAERKSAVMTEDQKKVTAYHEAGHALVTLMVEGEADPLHKVTIIPRGRALGVTMSLPEEDKVTHSKTYLQNQIAILMGGRIAEDLIFNEITTGASNDIERATDIARGMVTAWGMSEKVGAQNFSQDRSSIMAGDYSGRQAGHSFSSEAQKLVDAEVTRFINENYDRAEAILKKHMDKLHEMSLALLEHETLDKQQIDDLMEGKPVTPKKQSRRAKYQDAKRADAKVEEAKVEVEDKEKSDAKPKKKKASTAKKKTTPKK